MTDRRDWLDLYKIGSTELDGVYISCPRCPNWDIDQLDGRSISQLIVIAADHELHQHAPTLEHAISVIHGIMNTPRVAPPVNPDAV